jgi:hypothetical protein
VRSCGADDRFVDLFALFLGRCGGLAVHALDNLGWLKKVVFLGFREDGVFGLVGELRFPRGWQHCAELFGAGFERVGHDLYLIALWRFLLIKRFRYPLGDHAGGVDDLLWGELLLWNTSI